MNADLYPMIFKRKSFHLFRNVGNDKIDASELEDIKTAYEGFEALYPEIKTTLRIVPSSQVNFKRDAEYCILIYSEKKDNYLMNAGFLGEQLDLYLVSRNIGTLWYGIGKPDEAVYDGLDFVIMIAIRKVCDETKYRKDMFKAKRKPMEEIWKGETLGVAEIARFAPSACNTQPWYVENDGAVLTVSRYKNPEKHGIMPLSMAGYFNRIDIGIYLCFLEICMAKQGISASRELFVDAKEDGYSPVAKYKLVK